MARTPRRVVTGLPHHVVVRGNNRRRLFSFSTDYQQMLVGIAASLKKTGCRLHALTLMTNHVHLIVTPYEAGALAAFVKRFAQRYAQYRNRRRKSSGKLFEQRYFSVPILSSRQMAITTVYCDVNPVRAGQIEDPLDFAWSTFPFHVDASDISRIPYGIWTPSDWYLSLGQAPEERAEAYRQWTASCLVHQLRPDRVSALAVIEAMSSGTYSLRLERPDRTAAR